MNGFHIIGQILYLRAKTIASFVVLAFCTRLHCLQNMLKTTELWFSEETGFPCSFHLVLIISRKLQYLVPMTGQKRFMLK